ncbi:MAG TPA: HEAT repeat domain-containing protein [Gemmatimonadaceae bacterium]|nr:HEAT repeat domain-containing protein [Gemmatimonadaceae bacterium]
MHKLIVIAALAALGATTGANSMSAASLTGADVPKSWAPADVADSLWKQGRNAISDEDWRRAERLFSRIHEDYPKSAYAADSYYWEAFALSRRGGTDNVRDAVALLEKQIERFANASSVKNGDSKSLLTRLQGTLARGGDANAAAEISSRATAAAARADGAEARAAGSASRAGASVRVGSGRSRSSSDIPGCKSEDDDDRVEALNALLQMGSDDALPILKKVLARRDQCSEILRRKAVFLVSQKRGDEAADILVDAAKNDPDAEVREQAVFWLSQVNSSKAIPLLEQILKNAPNEKMQDQALFALSQKSDDRAQAVLRDYAGRDDAPDHAREQAVFWLGQRRSDENAKFLRDLFAKTTSKSLKDKIIFSISQTRNSGNDEWLLDQAVNTKNSMEIRKNALFWAGQNGSMDMAKVGALYDKGSETEFKKQVIFVLSQRGKSPEAIDKLIDIAKNEKDKELRKEAIFWLSQSHDPRVAKFLMDIINK